MFIPKIPSVSDSFLARHTCIGFTLLELMVVLSIVGILSAIAYPSFNNTIKQNSISTVRATFIHALKFARSEAVSRKEQVIVCASDKGDGCSGGWSQGWIIFADTNQNGSYNTGSDILLDTFYGDNRALINSSQGRFTFAQNGARIVLKNTTVNVCDTDIASALQGKSFYITAIGSIHLLDNASC